MPSPRRHLTPQLFPLLAGALALSPAALLRAADQAPDYNREIQPLLAEHCFHCHGQDESSRKAKLRLDLRDEALKGGSSDGPAIVPGKPDQSPLITRLLSHDEDEVMPPKKSKKPVRAADIELLKRWVASGAGYAKHWAFEPPRKAPIPGAAAASSNAVDAFVSTRLAREGLTLSPPAESFTLCRRLYLDLIGLPPSPREADDFCRAATQNRDAAVRELVDRLMSDRRFGEKWARHWLDVARYADSNGYEKDLPREQWIWRDWVIDATNRDLPYDEFLIEQVAGDMLPHHTKSQLIATGFLRNGMTNEEGAIVPEQFRMEGMFDRMDTIGSSVLGLSIKCGQCHTHKFDPLTQDEYYGMFAFLNNTYEAQSWVYSGDQEAKIAALRSKLAVVDQRIKQSMPDWQERMAKWEAAQVAFQGKAGWTLVEAEDLHSSTGLNHPTTLPDKSILVLGHRTVAGDVYMTAAPKLQNATGLRLEILKHDDLPFEGPGRSYKGTWALTELVVESQKPGSDKWEKIKLVNATADFAEPAHPMEGEWESARDKDHKRTCGPAAFLADGSDLTGWRADRGAGRRNTESVAVVQFEQPLTLPEGTKLKVALVTNHGGDDNGSKNTQIGRFRVALTTSPDPKVNATPYAAMLAMQTPPAERTPEQQAALFAAWRVTVSELKSLNAEIEALWKQFPEAHTSVLHLAERTGQDARQTFLLDRGVWDKAKQSINPHVPAALHALPKGAAPSRLTFAHWLADKNSPLTARVEVNRLWQALFGVGIQETAEDFGTRSPEPSNQALLDWLAVDFMEHGWSRKQLIRTIVTSAAYQQSSRVTPELLEKDPKNRLLSRGPRFRAEAEVVRDIALSTAGLLSPKIGGPSIFPPVPASVIENNYVKPTYWEPPASGDRYCRSLYVFRKRSMPDPALSAFDAPNSDFTCPRRNRSNSPLAALTAMNEPIFVEAAQAFALRVLREGGRTDADRAAYAFRLCTSRVPKPEERDKILELLATRRQRIADGWLPVRDLTTGDPTKLPALPQGTTPQDAAAWTIAARVLLNLDETLSKN